MNRALSKVTALFANASVGTESDLQHFEPSHSRPFSSSAGLCGELPQWLCSEATGFGVTLASAQ
jgi:hypothetical protein